MWPADKLFRDTNAWVVVGMIMIAASPGRLGHLMESGQRLVEVGDTVIVRFADDRIRRFRLSREANIPDQGIIHIGQPIAQALLGNGIDEELELLIDGHTKRVIIEKITKAAA